MVEDNSLLGSSMPAMGISLSPVILPCVSVGGPGKTRKLERDEENRREFLQLGMMSESLRFR